MQENTDSEKPEDSEIPENQEEGSDKEITSESTDSFDPDPSFEEQEGEVLPPEKKKGSGCGFFLLILLLLAGGGGYLYYTQQIPPQIKKWIEPLIKPLEQQFATQNPAPQPSEKWVSEIEEKFPTPETQNVIPKIEKKLTVDPPPTSEEHVSGSPTKITPDVEEPVSNYPVKVSGNTTYIEPEPLKEEPEVKAEKIEEPEVEPQEPVELEIAQVEEKFVPPTPVVKVPPILYAGEPKLEEETTQPKERDEAVQAYLDFFEATLVKIGKLIKTGFAKGKEFLLKYLG